MTKFKPPYWYQGNLKFSENDLKILKTDIDNLGEKKFSKDNKHMSTYFIEQTERPEKKYVEVYKKIVEDITKTVGIFYKTTYNVSFWTQLYDEGMTHNPHHHALIESDSESVISWVHFLDVPEQKCFRFTDTKGNTLAFYLVNTFEKSDEKSFEEKLKILINRGLSMNQKQNDGNSLLHIAAKKNNLELLRRLSQFGIDINAVNNSGYTVLHLASMMAKDESIIKYLLNEGADKNIKTEFDETAFTLAQENELLKNKNIEYLK